MLLSKQQQFVYCTIICELTAKVAAFVEDKKPAKYEQGTVLVYGEKRNDINTSFAVKQGQGQVELCNAISKLKTA